MPTVEIEKIENEKVVDKRVKNNKDLAQTHAIEGLYRALVYFQLKVIEHVRISKNSDEAIDRANHVTYKMQTVLADILKESLPSTTASNAVRRPIAMRAGGTHHCQAPHTWDPVTETCV